MSAKILLVCFVVSCIFAVAFTEPIKMKREACRNVPREVCAPAVQRRCEMIPQLECFDLQTERCETVMEEECRTN